MENEWLNFIFNPQLYNASVFSNMIHNASIYSCNYAQDGLRPIDIARSEGHSDIVSVLAKNRRAVMSVEIQYSDTYQFV